MKGRFTAWSNSRLTDYDKCPLFAKLKHLDKLPERENEAMRRGTQIHEGCAGFIANHPACQKLGKDLKDKKVSALLKKLKTGYAAKKVWVEMMLCFDRAWKLLPPAEKFSPAVWLRVKTDVIDRTTPKLVVVYDWKTGRYKPDGDYEEQLRLYTTAALSAGYGERACAKLVFTDHGEEVYKPTTDVNLDTLRAAQKTFEKRVSAMMNDKWFQPKPGPACQWCPYARNEGGPCDF